MPLLRTSAKVSQRKNQVVIEYLREQITLDGVAADLFGKMLPHLDGKTQVEGIAASLALPPARLRALVEKLGRLGIIAFVTNTHADAPRLSGLEFYELHRKYCAHWLEPIYQHPLWEKITTGSATRSQVIGFAFEKYHYIEGAYEHMGIAAANATPEMMPHLARHFIEEYNHGDIYRKGLRSLFPDDLVLTAQPLPSTRALVNFLSECAAQSSFAYYAGNELLQMTENSAEGAGDSVGEFYTAMRKHYPYTHKLIDSFIAHTHADQKLGHDNVFLEMCKSVPPLTREEVRLAMNTVRSMAEHLHLFMDGIDVHYGAFPAVPRVPCSLLSE
ncbi:MAG: hypothetical protein ABIP39_06575 [Polyangiaceae bacterium]